MGRKNKRGSFRGKSEKTEASFNTKLASILLSKHLVTSPEESVCLAESIIADMQDSELSKEQACMTAFEDYFSYSRTDAKNLLSSLFGKNGSKDDDESDASNSLEEHATETLAPDGDLGGDNDASFIGEGECELCERFIRLTKHHLVPKATWPRILPRLANASNAISRNDIHRAALILGPGLAHLTKDLTSIDNKTELKGLLQITCDICRPCHSAIHRTYDNMTLATNFSTTELLMKDPAIYNFCRWASKQKPGKYKSK